MSEKLNLPDLKNKIVTLESIFGKKTMRAGLNPRTVDGWLKSPSPNPNLSSLIRYFGAISMRPSEIIASKETFVLKVAEICSEKEWVDNYTPEEVAAIYDSLKKEPRISESTKPKYSPVFFKRTRNRLTGSEIKGLYEKYAGQYYLYRHWKREGIPEEMIFRYFIEVYKFDPNSNTVHFRYESPLEHFTVARPISEQRDVAYNSLVWVYEGSVVFTDIHIYWLMERTEGFPEIISFVTNSLATLSDSYMPGIHMSLTPGPAHGMKGTYTPSASRVVLEKLKKEIKGKSKVRIGYFYPKEILKEGHEINIPDYINNEVRDGNDVLGVKNVKPPVPEK